MKVSLGTYELEKARYFYHLRQHYAITMSCILSAICIDVTFREQTLYRSLYAVEKCARKLTVSIIHV